MAEVAVITEVIEVTEVTGVGVTEVVAMFRPLAFGGIAKLFKKRVGS